MKLSMQLCILCAVVILGTDATIFFERNTKDRSSTGMCYSSVFQRSIKVGKTYQTPNCGEMYCDEDYIISYAGCISGNIPEDCVETAETRALPYPLCCPVNYCFQEIQENQDQEGSLII